MLLCRVQWTSPISLISKPLPPSPPSSFTLPVYVKQVAAMMSRIESPQPQRQVQNYHKGVLKYLDVEAQEGFGSEGSSDDME
jgi:hypothetical protein